jgi:hypothetical protein
MKRRIVILIRAICGGEVEDRAAVRLAKALRSEAVPPVAIVEALTRSIERVLVEKKRAAPRLPRLGLLCATIFGAFGGTIGLRAMSAITASPSPILLSLPAAGALIGLGAAIASYLPERGRSGREAAAVAFELARAGVGTMTALDVALYAAGRASSSLRACLEAAPIAEDASPDRARAAVAVLTSELIGSGEDRGIFATAAAVFGAAWVIVSVWLLYFFALAAGFDRMAT